MCREHGIHPEQLCNLMNQSISPKEIIFTDGAQLDKNWGNVFYCAGSKESVVHFSISHSDRGILLRMKSDNKKYFYFMMNLQVETRKVFKEQHWFIPLKNKSLALVSVLSEVIQF